MPSFLQLSTPALRRFATCESGAVTVDWVVLTASIVGLGLGATVAVRTGVVDLGEGINAALSGAAVAGVNLSGTGASSQFVYTPLVLGPESIAGYLQWVEDILLRLN